MIRAQGVPQPENPDQPDDPVAWFCVRTQPKHEHIAAGRLKSLTQVEVFCPRIRFKRPTRRGPVWFTEALFPGYFFARFAWRHDLRIVHYSPGVRGIVHFGDRWPTVDEIAIQELQASCGETEVHEIPAVPAVGDEVAIAGGAFHGLVGCVTRMIPGRQRVGILLEFLGRQTCVEVSLAEVAPASKPSGRLVPRPKSV